MKTPYVIKNQSGALYLPDSNEFVPVEGMTDFEIAQECGLEPLSVPAALEKAQSLDTSAMAVNTDPGPPCIDVGAVFHDGRYMRRATVTAATSTFIWTDLDAMSFSNYEYHRRVGIYSNI